MRFLLNLWFETDDEYNDKELPKIGAFKGSVDDKGQERPCWFIEINSIEELVALCKEHGQSNLLLTDFLGVDPYLVIRLGHECE